MRTRATRSSTATKAQNAKGIECIDAALPTLASDDDSDDEELIMESPRKAAKKVVAKKATATTKPKEAVKKVANKAPSPKEPAKMTMDDSDDSDGCDSDDDDDCDIGIMLKQVQQTRKTFVKKKSPKRKKRRSSVSKYSNGLDDDSDDSDDDDDAIEKAPSSDDESAKCSGSDGSSDDSSEDESPPKRGAPTKRPKNFSQKLAQKSRRTAFKRAAQRTSGVNQKDSDSDSDIEIVGEDDDKKANNISLNMDDSSDEEDMVKSLSKDVSSGGFAKAKLALLQSQKYHAEDVAVPDTDDIPARGNGPVLSNSTNRAGYSSNAATASACKKIGVSREERLGSIVRLKLKSRELNGTGNAAGSPTTAVYDIRKREPIKALMDNFLSRNNLTRQTAVVSFMFKNKKLAASSTPDECGMTSNCVINVDVKRVGSASATAKTASQPDTGKQILLKLRVQNGQEVEMTIGEKEVFRALLDRYKQQNPGAANPVFHFDGEVLDLTTTPATDDLEDGDIIDVVMK